MPKVSAKQSDQTNESVSPFYGKRLSFRDKIFRIIVVAVFEIIKFMPVEFKWREYHNIWNDRDHNDYMRDSVVTDGYNLAILDSSADTPKNAYLAKRNETKNTLQSNHSRLIISLHSFLILLT